MPIGLVNQKEDIVIDIRICQIKRGSLWLPKLIFLSLMYLFFGGS